MNQLLRIPLILLLLFAVLPAVSSAQIQITLDPQAADAMLSILAKNRRGEPLEEADWRRLFDSDGYRRLGERKAAMGREFGEAWFQEFGLSEELAGRAAALETTLAAWRQIEFASLAAQVLDYLPPDASIKATIYPMIKPRGNSFVFDLTGDPAIFLYLDPEVTPEKFINTVLHELHHIGLGGSCPTEAVQAEIDALPEGTRKVLRWIGAFGEGFAMLAAAGGTDVHPHAVSEARERARWDADVARCDDDLRMLEGFFLDLLAGRLTEEQEVATARSFYGVQGPWYAVGWCMVTTIERAFGKRALIDAFCDPRRFLPTYNRAVAHSEADAAVWSEALLKGLVETR